MGDTVYDPNSGDDPTNSQDSSNDDAAGADDTTDQGEQEAPVPTEPAPVTVQPSETPTEVKTDKVFDKDYEVTPERGYRVQKPAPVPTEQEQVSDEG